MSTSFRCNALNLLRLARETTQVERKVRLLAMAQEWLSLADHERKVRRLVAETERLADKPAAD
jgi:hypothetical protein